MCMCFLRDENFVQLVVQYFNYKIGYSIGIREFGSDEECDYQGLFDDYFEEIERRLNLKTYLPRRKEDNGLSYPEV